MKYKVKATFYRNGVEASVKVKEGKITKLPQDVSVKYETVTMEPTYQNGPMEIMMTGEIECEINGKKKTVTRYKCEEIDEYGRDLELTWTFRIE